LVLGFGVFSSIRILKNIEEAIEKKMYFLHHAFSVQSCNRVDNKLEEIGKQYDTLVHVGVLLSFTVPSPMLWPVCVSCLLGLVALGDGGLSALVHANGLKVVIETTWNRL